MWEDGRNSAGGRWLLQLHPAKNNTRVDDCWKNIVRIKLIFVLLNFRLKSFIVLDNEYNW